VRTKVKIPQHNGLDANSFLVRLFSKLKSAKNILDGPIKILGTKFFGDAQQPEAKTFFGLSLYR